VEQFEFASFIAPKIRFHQPERNLPGRKLRCTTIEDRLTIRFARAYRNQAHLLHYGTGKNKVICARQIAVNGFGIADLVAISFKSEKVGRDISSIEKNNKIYKPTIRAFEIKVSDWRKGMMQAYRYKYYANTSILVLPSDRCSAAIPFFETFRKIRVGLWGFNDRTGRIHNYYTPQPTAAKEAKYYRRVLGIFANLPRSQRPLENS